MLSGVTHVDRHLPLRTPVDVDHPACISSITLSCMASTDAMPTRKTVLISHSLTSSPGLTSYSSAVVEVSKSVLLLLDCNVVVDDSFLLAPESRAAIRCPPGTNPATGIARALRATPYDSATPTAERIARDNSSASLQRRGDCWCFPELSRPRDCTELP